MSKRSATAIQICCARGMEEEERDVAQPTVQEAPGFPLSFRRGRRRTGERRFVSKTAEKPRVLIRFHPVLSVFQLFPGGRLTRGSGRAHFRPLLPLREEGRVEEAFGI